MCLSHLSKIHPIPNNIGWKLFIKECDLYYPFVMERPRMVENTWYTDDCPMALETGDKFVFYPAGFHFYLSEEDAEKYLNRVQFLSKPEDELIIKQIEVAEVVAMGFQQELEIGVARKIKILPD